MANRRTFLQSALGLGAGLFSTRTLTAAGNDAHPNSSSSELLRRDRVTHPGPFFNTPVITPDIGDLPYTLEGGVKVFRLTAQVVKQQVAPGKRIDVWGFNGSAPGPTIQVTEGDRVRVVFRNELPEPSSIHWHGFEDRIGYDGQPGISQAPVKPGEEFTYEFDIHQEGTYFYHSHMAMQEMAGMLGAFIMHPREPYRPHCDKDFAINLQEYAVLPANTTPNTMAMEYNWLLLNGKAGPATTPLIVRQGDRVRIRFVNLGMDHHPMHLHGHTFQVTGTEGGRIPETAWWPGNTVLVGVAQTRTIEFVANNPGDWMVHCHLPHHMMNGMASQVGRMTRAAGGSMDAGMGMAMSGAPLSPEYGASVGRGMGPGTDAEMATTNGALSAGGMDMGEMAKGEIAPNANRVPNFPQDAFMEGPMMAMDGAVERPENHGLRPGWSQFMQGMMTFLRVLPPDRYDEVVGRMRAANRAGDPYASLWTPGWTPGNGGRA